MPGMTFTLSSHPFGNSGMHVYLAVGILIVAAISLLMLSYLTNQPSNGASSESNNPFRSVKTRSPANRRIRFISLSFGSLWLIDGFLQLRNAMPTQFVSSIIKPAFALAPAPIQFLSHIAIQLWTLDPVKADIGAAYLQLTVGLGMMFLNRGPAWRIIVKLSIIWSLVIFVFGNGFGIFYKGASFATGAPSAILIYLFASIEILKLEKEQSVSKSTKRIGRFLGAFIFFGSLLGTIPNESFWKADGYYQMIKEMAISRQPELISILLNGGASLVNETGQYVNASLVIAGVAVAVALYFYPTKRSTLIAAVLITTTTWIFVQDFGVFSATGTDSNSGSATLVLTLSLLSNSGTTLRGKLRHRDHDYAIAMVSEGESALLL